MWLMIYLQVIGEFLCEYISYWDIDNDDTEV